MRLAIFIRENDICDRFVMPMVLVAVFFAVAYKPSLFFGLLVAVAIVGIGAIVWAYHKVCRFERRCNS